MLHVDEQSAPTATDARWVPERKTPPAAVGRKGELGQAVGGDVLVVQDGGAYRWVAVAWQYADATEVRAVCPRTGRVNLRSEGLSTLPHRTPGRWLGVRAR